MNRRKFIKSSSVASAGLLSTNFNYSNQNNVKNNFNLRYAPHLGMFESHSGNDPISQLQFMIDQGFTAFEDNNMKNRNIQTLFGIGAHFLVFIMVITLLLCLVTAGILGEE